MGMFKMSRCDCKCKPVTAVTVPNPDPRRFEIIRVISIGCYVVAEIIYAGCTNYEGRKICLFETSIRELSSLDTLDPHFCEGDHTSPIARFEPTKRGWSMAIKLAESISSEERKEQ